MHGMVKVKIRVETMSEWTALTCHQVMWEGEWRDVYAKTTAAFTRSYIHFSFSLIVSKGVQALMQLLTHTPGPHTPHVIHMSLFRSLTSSHPLNVSAWVHHSYGFDVPIRSCLQWRVLVLGPWYNKYESHGIWSPAALPLLTHPLTLWSLIYDTTCTRGMRSKCCKL